MVADDAKPFRVVEWTAGTPRRLLRVQLMGIKMKNEVPCQMGSGSDQSGMGSAVDDRELPHKVGSFLGHLAGQC